MHEIIYNLPQSAVALDLGSGAGSYDAPAFPFTTIRVDVEARAPRAGGGLVLADAARLPFRDGAFDAVICNHGLEHFVELDGALGEIGRVVKAGGCLYVAIPDAGTLHDRLYRGLTCGGGHVNAFRDAGVLAGTIAGRTGLRHFATKVLFASFGFLNHRNVRRPCPRLLGWFAIRREGILFLFTAFLRGLDRRFGTGAMIYGWCMYFGAVPEPVVTKPWTNVCVRCGQGHPSEWLAEVGALERRWRLFAAYRCPGCGCSNPYSDDRDFARLG